MPPRGRAGSGTEKPIFKDLVIAIAGPLEGQWTDLNVSRWVSQRAGRFAAQMSAAVTHLVCSDEAFKARGPRVKEALERNAKPGGKKRGGSSSTDASTSKCFLVTKDWLEDSINAKKRLSEEEFGVDKAEKQARRKKKEEMRKAKGEEMALRAVNPDLYHTYRDRTFFKYKVVISRVDEGVERRFELSLHESNNARPHLYHFVAKFFKRKGDSQPNYYRPSATPGCFSREFGLFTHFFEKRTGIPWEKRLVLCRRPRALAAPGGADDAGEEPEKALTDGERREIWHKLEDEGRRFFYEPPTGGKPVGWAPKEFIPIVVDEEGVKPQAARTSEGKGDSPTRAEALESEDVVMTDAADVVMVDTDDVEVVEGDEERQMVDTNAGDSDVEDGQEEVGEHLQGNVPQDVQENAKEAVQEEAEEDLQERVQEDIEMAAASNTKDKLGEKVQEDAAMTAETSSKGLDRTIDESQEATAMTTNTNTAESDTSVNEVQDATATLTDARTQHPGVEVQEAAVETMNTATNMDMSAEDTSVNGARAVMASILAPNIFSNLEEIQETTATASGTNAHVTGGDEAPEAIAPISDLNIIIVRDEEVQEVTAMAVDAKSEDTGVEEIQEHSAMTIESNIQHTNIEEVQEATDIMNTDAATEVANVNEAQGIVAMLRLRRYTHHPVVDEVGEGDGMTTDSNIKDASVDEAQGVTPITTDAKIQDTRVEETQNVTGIATNDPASGVSTSPSSGDNVPQTEIPLS